MIQLKSMLNVIDNSGAKLVECIRVHEGKIASLGDMITVVVKKAKPNSTKVQKAEIHKAVIVRTRKEVRRPDGRYIRFDDNACVLVNAEKQPLGTRILGVVANELRMKKFAKVISLAPKVV
ncbi:39S ribosomal protein L38, mitochondrial [Coelomomyces lativittatus]|nr:39S ribosomal protein L38, mitochondrial [Coelomomyces lativittatus]KAJ1516954.1 39S ribosomal protein L38, mitochondrial [Coelomomyces lativittatus]